MIYLNAQNAKKGLIIAASRVRKEDKFYVPSGKYGKAIIIVGQKGTQKITKGGVL